ncbi:MAG: L-rhamnose isomerase [Defluviitaleaceae bacterium]|nr:L-rhamnose isomerase [Defluviitaleaceae bacterium]
MDTNKYYEFAKEMYSKVGVNTDTALDSLGKIKISIHCWQGDDVAGFLNKSDQLTGGIQVTGNYPGAAKTADQLRADISKALSLIPGNHKLNLHSIYADTTENIDLDLMEPKHFESWLNFAKEKNLGLDFNPTFFSHPKASDGFTLSSANKDIRAFWIEHGKRSRKIAEHFGRELGQTAINNIWIPDGFKDKPVDRLSPRERLCNSLGEILKEKYENMEDALESKLFGIGAESYTVGSHEFYAGYAVKNNTYLCLDSGHFHPTEMVSDKLSAVSLFVKGILLHVSRPVRWDSDHVVILDDELQEIANELIYNNLLTKTAIGLDFFDASINRVAAWVVGVRSTLKALLKAMLMPHTSLRKAEQEGDYTTRLALAEEMKTYPFGIVWDYYCHINNIPKDWLAEVKDYECRVLSKRR